MIIQDIRTIRIAFQSIREQHFSHNIRNHRLVVMCTQIDQIILKHRNFIYDSWLRDHRDLREQLLDGMAALRTIAHPNVNQIGDAIETHREVKHRLRLLEDLATFLIRKAEEAQPAAMSRDGDDLPI